MTEQEKREKVIKALECCISGNPAICKRVGCPYAEEHDGIGDTCIDHLMADALALLKAQEPVVRCRDCKYGKICFDADGHGLIQCTNTNYPAANIETWPLELDWFCAGGERRDGK